MKCLKPHWKRFTESLDQRNQDFYEGHSWVNLFAEALRCLKVPERIIKFRLPLINIGLPHVLSIVPPFFVVYVWILGAWITANTRRNNSGN